MKSSSIVLIASALGATLAHGAAPSVSSLAANSVHAGSPVTLSAQVSDPDGDLDYARFEVAGPGISGWQTLSDVDVNGTQSSPSIQWTPSQSGLYTARVTVFDLSSSASQQRTLDVFAETKLVSNLTVNSGVSTMISSPGQIITAETASTGVSVKNNGTLIFWSGGRVTLRPGFRAENGAFFWAAVDHNMNGYSDMEELVDTDGDGIFDAWEVDHGLNMLANDANSDLDGDGATNLAEFLSGRNPNDRSDSGQLPSGYQLVLRLPANQYYGVKTPSGEITAVSAP